jgi:large subunit ribosomal protein L18
MSIISKKLERAERRKMRVRRKIFGDAERPRLTVHKSLRNIVAQIIDDEKMSTIVALATNSKGITETVVGKKKTEAAAIVGAELAKLAIEKGIKQVRFDRNRNVYHGRVKAVADAARKAGLEF